MRWNNYTYKIEQNEAVILEYAGEETHLVIPKEIEGFPVTKLANGAFCEHGSLIERIEVPGSVKVIDDFAFKMCMSLTELVLSEGVEVLGENILYVTSVSDLHLPSTIRKIGKPYELGDVAWTVEAHNPVYQTDGYALYERRGDGWWLVAVQKEDVRTSYQVMDGTSGIADRAFEGQMNLEHLIIPESLTCIGEEAFESCQNLKTVDLPEGLVRIEADAFRYCVKLERLHLPSTLRFLGERALTDTFGWSDRLNGISFLSVAQPNPVFWADDCALYEKDDNQKITLVKYFGTEREYCISSQVSVIGESAFRRSNVRYLTIPNSVCEIKKDAFRECKNLESVELVTDDVRLYVPKVPVYRKDEIVKPLYGEKQQMCYDYPAYDALFDTWSQILEQCKMACFRLSYPIQLTDARKESYQKLVLEHLTEVITDICQTEDMEYLAQLATLGFFTGENIDAVIDLVNRFRKAKLTGYLMNYKQEHLGVQEFDFSL